MFNNRQILFFGLLLYLLCWLLMPDVYWLALTAIPITFFALFFFIKNLGNQIAFRELAFFVACLQLLFASLFAFYYVDPLTVFEMKGPPERYFNYAVPGVLAFGLGLFVFKNKVNWQELSQKFYHYDIENIGKYLILIGYLGSIMKLLPVGGLNYFFSLIGMFKYIGGIYILFSDNKKKILWLILSYFPVILSSIGGGVFYLILVWGAFLMLYVFIYRNYSFKKKAFLILGSIALIFVLGMSKHTYRNYIRAQETYDFSFVEKVGLLGNIYINNLISGDFFSERNLRGRITRANQGAIVTWIMDHTPYYQPYGKGKTIYEAVYGAIVPRILDPDKVKAGGQRNYEKYTGKNLRGTSINLSLLGEGYANFGVKGGIIFMFAVGLMYSYLFKVFLNYCKKNPAYIFWVPYFFIYSIKAEDDLVTPLNHLIKAVFVFVFFNWFFFHKFVEKQRKTQVSLG